jgi:hypothetical protein
MAISPPPELTGSAESRFFLAPETALHRQYEALRAYFVEQLPSHEVASRFGYTPGSFRVLCHQFRHDPHWRTAFFCSPRQAPAQTQPANPIRDLVIAMRKRNLSVYDIQRELAEAGHTASINALATLLRQEGFARLPRRRDDERPQAVHSEVCPPADVRLLSLAPRRFRTRLGGLFLFVPLMRDLRLHEVVARADLPGSAMIPALQAVRTLLALKLVGKQRKSHVMNLVEDQGIAVFAGINVVPKRSYLAAYSSQVDRRANLRLLDAWSDEVRRAGLPRGNSFEVDFHTIAANSAQEPLEKHYVSRRSRRQQGILVFVARDAEQRVLCYGNAGVSKDAQADEVLRFVDFWERHTGAVPAELVFDSQLTTYANLNRLNQRNVGFLTLRRRSRKLLGRIFSRPASAWQRITLPSLSRTFRTPKVLDERVGLKGYVGQLRQVSVIDLGHEEPTILLTNDEERTCPQLVTRYAERMLIENGIAEAIGFFHLDALSSMVGLKVDFDLQVTLIASALYRLLGQRVGGEYARAQARTLFEQLLDIGATVEVDAATVVVRLDKHAHNPFLVASRLADQPTPMPWFGGKLLYIRFS